MELKLLDPAATLELLEGHRDIVTDLAKKREEFYQSQSCMHCGGSSLKKVGDVRTMFRGNDPIPHYTLSCADCGCHFDPHTRLVLKMGNVAKAFEPALPIIKND